MATVPLEAVVAEDLLVTDPCTRKHEHARTRFCPDCGLRIPPEDPIRALLAWLRDGGDRAIYSTNRQKDMSRWADAVEELQREAKAYREDAV